MRLRVIFSLIFLLLLSCASSPASAPSAQSKRFELICPALPDVQFRLGSTIGPDSEPHVNTDAGLIWPMHLLHSSGPVLESVAVVEKVSYSEPGWSVSPPPPEIPLNDPRISRTPALELHLTPGGAAALDQAFEDSPGGIAPAIGLQFRGMVVRWAVLTARPLTPVMLFGLSERNLEAAAATVRASLDCTGEAAA